MLERLRKLAGRSSELREAVLEKDASLLGRAAGWALKNPMTALGVGVSAAMTPGAAMGTYKKHKAGFNTEQQQAQLGQTPTPPQQG